MKKALFIPYLTLILIFSVLVTPQSLDVIESSVSMVIYQGATEQTPFTVENTGSTPITLEITHNLDLIDNDGDEIILSFSDPGEILPGNSTIITITAQADPKMDFETYKGTVTVEDTNTTASDTFQLTIKVEPDVCDHSQVGDDLKIKIENADEDDDFEPGDTIKIDVTVENNGNDDIRTQVEAFLFSDKSEITSSASDTKNINDEDEEDFQFSLNIPLDSRKIDEKDDFTLYLKAFDDDNEKLNCIQEQIPINIELSSKKIIIDESNTRFLPSAAACGDTVLANIRVVNIGKKDNDRVTISLLNSELSISKRSDIFSIEKFKPRTYST